MAKAHAERPLVVTLVLDEDEAKALATLTGYIVDNSNELPLTRIFNALSNQDVSANHFHISNGTLFSG